MNMHDIGVPDISALVRFGKLGMHMMAARILSILALCGFFALSFYTVYLAPSWQGAVVCGIAAIVSMAAVRAESAARQAPDGGAPNA